MATAKKEAQNNQQVYELMNAIRSFTRSTLMLQHIIAESMKLRVTDAECIDFLQEMQPSTAGALAKATRLTTGAITNVIDRLEKAGYVKRSSDANDRRKVMLTYIEKKGAKNKKYYQMLAENIEDLFAGYDAKTLALLINHTQVMTEIYQQTAQKIESIENKSKQ